MRADIKIPAMGESISEATIGRFLKQAGAQVTENEEIIELETEKVNQVLYAPASGVLTWNVKEGDSLPIGSLLGFVEKGAAPLSMPPPEEKKEAPSTATVPPPAQKAPVEAKKEEKKSKLREPRKIKESFVAELKGEKPAAEPPREVTEEKEGERRRMSKIRQTIAKRLVKSLHESAMLTTFNEVDMSAILALREKYKDSFAKKYDVKLGFMSFFVKAVVEAIKTFPDFNAYIEGDEIVQNLSIDIGIAVSTERGLIVPVIRKCDHLTFAEIEKSVVNFAKKARDGNLTLDDLRGGGFTITNGGVFGSLLSTPILNPPQVGILGMHKIMKRAVVIDDAIVIRPMMYLALSYDHRLIDGKEAVTFLIKLKEVLEDPSQLLYLEGE